MSRCARKAPRTAPVDNDGEDWRRGLFLGHKHQDRQAEEESDKEGDGQDGLQRVHVADCTRATAGEPQSSEVMIRAGLACTTQQQNLQQASAVCFLPY